MKEHHSHHHGNNGHHGHHRKSSSAHAEHINILDKLGNSIKEMATFLSKLQDEVKRGLELIDTSVNQLAQAKWILINIEKTLGESYSDCPVCNSQDYKSAGKHLHTSPVKIKTFSNEPVLIIKKDDIISPPPPPQKSKILNSSKAGPKSKTRQVENEKQSSPSTGCSTTQRPPCNYSKEKSFSTRKSEKDKPLIKLSDISNVIRGRKRVNLNDYPSLQGPKRKKQKVSVSNDDSDSDAVSYSTLKRKKPKHKGSVSDEGSDGSYSLSSILKRKKPKHKASVSDDGSDGSYALSTSKRKKSKSSPNKRYKSKEIITSDDSSSDDGKKLEAIRKKKHKHRHDKDKHDRDRHKPKSKVKEFGSKSEFLERMSVTKSVCGSDVSKSTSKADKHEKRRKSDSPDRRDSRRDDKEHKVKVRKEDKEKEKGSRHREEKSKKVDSDDDESIDQTLRDEVSKIDFDDNSSEDERPKSVVEDKSKKSERKSIDIKEKHKENDSDNVKNTVNCKVTNEKNESSDTKENAPSGKGDISKSDTKEKPEKDKSSIKAMLLSKAKPDLQQKLLEKFKQFAATRKAPSEAKQPAISKTDETKEMESIGLTIEKENKPEKREEGIANSILTSIQPPMALQDMIEQDEINEKRGSGDSVDEFIKSVLQNNNDTVTEKDILNILKENYLIDDNNKVVELKEETQHKFKATIRQFQSVVVAHLQGGPTSTGNKVDSGGDEASSNSDDTSHTVGAQGTSGNTITNNEQGNVVILNDSQLPSGELTVGNYFLIGREGYPLQLMKYIGGNNFEPLQMSNFTPQQLNAVKNSLI